MKRKKLKFIFSLLVLITCSIFLVSCIIYGSPDSVFVNFVGRDLDNFVEHKKTDIISTANMDYTIIYVKETYIEKRPPEVRTKGMYLVKHLVSKKLIDGSENIIFTEGNNLYLNEYAISDKDTQRLYYIFYERSISYKYTFYLAIYDIINMQIIDKIMILDNSNRTSIYRMIFDKNNNKLLFQITGEEYLSLDMNTGEKTVISEDVFKKTVADLNIPENNNTYISNNIIMRFFSIYPYSDYLPANYKHKYNGLYINDGVNNIRISKVDNYLLSPVLWLEEGKYLIQGSYLFDTSGKMKENKIADGNVLVIY